jgi:hypothetical protein
MRERFANGRKLQRVGNGVGATLPIQTLRRYGLVDEDDQPREVEADPFLERTEDGDRLLLEVPLEE